MKLKEFKYRKRSKKINSCYILTTDSAEICFYGSHIILNDFNESISCTEDKYRTRSGKLANFGDKTRFMTRELMREMYCLYNHDFVIKKINYNDYVLKFDNDYKFILYSDDLASNTFLLEMDSIELEWNKYIYKAELKEIENCEIIDAFYGFYSEYANLSLKLNNNFLVIFSFVKIYKNSEIIYISYDVRTFDNIESIMNKTKLLLCGEKIIKVLNLYDYLYKFEITGNIELYLYIDSRFKNFCQFRYKNVEYIYECYNFNHGLSIERHRNFTYKFK